MPVLQAVDGVDTPPRSPVVAWSRSHSLWFPGWHDPNHSFQAAWFCLKFAQTIVSISLYLHVECARKRGPSAATCRTVTTGARLRRMRLETPSTTSGRPGRPNCALKRLACAATSLKQLAKTNSANAWVVAEMRVAPFCLCSGICESYRSCCLLASTQFPGQVFSQRHGGSCVQPRAHLPGC